MSRGSSDQEGRPIVNLRPDFSSLPVPPLLDQPPPVTPLHTMHPELLGSRLAIVADAFPGRQVRFAYSLKTNPHRGMVRAAAALGMDMEAITYAEADLALREGVSVDRLVLNGPGKWWRSPAAVSCRALFVNSLTEFAVIESSRAEGMDLQAGILGIRLKSAAMNSRFGMPAEDAAGLREAARRMLELGDSQELHWGVHVHHAQSASGTDAWIERCVQALGGVSVLAEELGSVPRLVDFGGGWRANDLPQAPASAQQVADSAPELLAGPETEWEFEFGKALVEPLGVVYSRVLMPPDEKGSVIVDAGMGDMFEGMVAPHRAYVWRDGWVRLGDGTSLIHGRTCVEHDVLVRDVDTSGLRMGDALAFGDAGGYDVALSFDFTNGRVRPGWFS